MWILYVLKFSSISYVDFISLCKPVLLLFALVFLSYSYRAFPQSLADLWLLMYKRVILKSWLEASRLRDQVEHTHAMFLPPEPHQHYSKEIKGCGRERHQKAQTTGDGTMAAKLWKLENRWVRRDWSDRAQEELMPEVGKTKNHCISAMRFSRDQEMAAPRNSRMEGSGGWGGSCVKGSWSFLPSPATLGSSFPYPFKPRSVFSGKGDTEGLRPEAQARMWAAGGKKVGLLCAERWGPLALLPHWPRDQPS